MTQQPTITQLSKTLADVPELELDVLVGSQTNGTATAGSDWDIAIKWVKHISPLDHWR